MSRSLGHEVPEGFVKRLYLASRIRLMSTINNSPIMALRTSSPMSGWRERIGTGSIVRYAVTARRIS